MAAQELFSRPQPESFQLAEELRRKWLWQHLDVVGLGTDVSNWIVEPGLPKTFQAELAAVA